MEERKWQRITYMPGTPLGRDGRRVTGSREHIALSRRAAREGMVLLKNEGGVLPFAAGTKLAVFGKAQADYVKGGGGSGDTTVAYVRSILDGLEEKQAEGRLELFAPLSAYYRENAARQRAQGCAPGQTAEPPVPAELLAQARRFCDTALITICRFSGEGWDRTGAPFDGDFFLSREELAMVDAVRGEFPCVAVVLNTGGMMDSSWFREDARIGAALLAWQAGMEGGSATADILCGDECPSGHLSDTFAVDFDAYPSSAKFNESEDYVEYTDDIYVGYRYFETIPGAAEKVCYPFGFGLSYTSFALTEAVYEAQEYEFSASALIQNTGSVAGRYVAQVYCQPPQGRLGKPRRVLVGFAKTDTLAPGAAQRVRIHFSARDFASYDDLGKICASAWLLEKGEYRFFIGGIDSIRGYDSEDLAPRDPKYHDEIGGDRMGFLNFEYIWTFHPEMGIALVPFFDIGYNIDSRQTSDPFSDLKKSVGLELRWRSPMGDLRFAYGFPLDKNVKGDRPGGRFEFSMGQFF